MKLTIKNQAQPFLKVELPPGASILTAEVSGEKVKPVQGTDGARVPLLRSGFHPVGVYTVSFVFLHSGAPFAKKGDSNISLPKMDVPINMVEWELFLPDQFKVKAFTGDAMSASLLPARLESFARVDVRGDVSGGLCGVAGGVANLPVSGREVASLSLLGPAIALSPGQLGGYVVDPTGAAIPNARLEVQSLSTNATWNTASTADGFWLIQGLPSGTYQIVANSPGFRPARFNVSYDASVPRAYRISLNVGAASDEVTVEASALEMNIETSNLSSKDKKHKKESLAAAPTPPQASANVFSLQQRVAGVLPVAVDVPHAGTSYRFVRPLVVNEETKLNFTYKSK